MTEQPALASAPLAAENHRPERDQTDHSLRTERSNTDEALDEKRAVLEGNADALIEKARDQADVVLEKARDRADDKLGAGVAAAPDEAAVAKARTLEDAAVEAGRAAADESLRRERAAQAVTLAKLLPLEREKTDLFLLTERERSDEALAQRDDFMGVVSHDLRNLLAGIALSATMLAKQASQSEEGLRTVDATDRIQRYVARMNRLIGDLVDVVSIDAGKLAVRPARSDAAALVVEAVESYAQLAAEKGVALVAEIIHRPSPAEFDHDRLLQVLMNLISNALKFTPKGGKIGVRCERSGEDLLLSVRDSGAGIAPDKLQKIFQRFWQVDQNDRAGLGLGLYISKCIVDAHGGKIWAESTLGRGSVFHCTIPVVAA